MRTCLADLAMKDRKVYPFVGAFCSRFDGFFSGFFTMSQHRPFSCFCLPPWMAFVTTSPASQRRCVLGPRHTHTAR